jgi:hypothetical protein
VRESVNELVEEIAACPPDNRGHAAQALAA